MLSNDWEYHGSKFNASNNSEKIKLSFTSFVKSNFFQPKQLVFQKIKTLGIVAGFYNF